MWVYPAIEDNIKINIDDKDLRIDTYRSSGAGGQHVNTTDSAVRITHLPTKVVVQCQNERSQHKNKETCFKMLRARLYEYEDPKKREESQKQLNIKTDIGWGHQIRSYVLQPYQLVKDLRNKTESSNPLSVLDGNIDQFIEEGLKNKIMGKIIKIVSLSIFFVLLTLILVLSFLGIETRKFNILIENKIKETNFVNLELDKIKFKLDLREDKLIFRDKKY